jgi:hypothetical protein
MPTKREVLELLAKNELVALLDAHDVAVEDRRKKDAIIDALSRARSVKVENIVGDLSRDRLKELCRALGLDEGGREKSALIQRLAGASATSAKTNGAEKSNGVLNSSGTSGRRRTSCAGRSTRRTTRASSSGSCS